MKHDKKTTKIRSSLLFLSVYLDHQNEERKRSTRPQICCGSSGSYSDSHIAPKKQPPSNFCVFFWVKVKDQQHKKNQQLEAW